MGNNIISEIRDFSKFHNDIFIRKAMRHLASETLGEERSFEILLSDHCDLNCACCNHYAPLAEKHFYPLDLLKSDLAKISDLFSGKICAIFIGGEPVLYPHLKEILLYSKNLFSNKIIFTNGLKLVQYLKNSDFDLFNVIKETGTSIILTKYPVVEYQPLIDFFEKEKISFRFIDDRVHKRRESAELSICGPNLEGTSNKFLKFLSCGNGNATVTLREGRFYTCPFKATINHFMKYFHLEEIPLKENEDYLTVSKIESKEQLQNFFIKPSNACRFCGVDIPALQRKKRTWGITKRDISEWIEPDVGKSLICKIEEGKESINDFYNTFYERL